LLVIRSSEAKIENTPEKIVTMTVPVRRVAKITSLSQPSADFWQVQAPSRPGAI
jgi:hypothetical protein